MDLSVERIEEAARVIDPVFRGSPQFVHDQLSEALGRRVLEAMRLTLATLGVVPEPAGAAGIVAIRGHDLPGDRLATVITGGNIRPDLLAGLCAVPAPAAPTSRGT